MSNAPLKATICRLYMNWRIKTLKAHRAAQRELHPDGPEHAKAVLKIDREDFIRMVEEAFREYNQQLKKDRSVMLLRAGQDPFQEAASAAGIKAHIEKLSGTAAYRVRCRQMDDNQKDQTLVFDGYKHEGQVDEKKKPTAWLTPEEIAAKKANAKARKALKKAHKAATAAKAEEDAVKAAAAAAAAAQQHSVAVPTCH